MQVKELYKILQSESDISIIEVALDNFEKAAGSSVQWIPVGNRENNVGTIEGSSDPGRSIIERITNGIDAILELEYLKHNGLPDCRSPREAANAWLNVPPNGLSELSPAQRRSLAQQILIRIQPGSGREKRIVEVRDFGIGIAPEQMQDTILSLNESNKLKKYYVAGMYGQGGSSTFARSKYTVIASRDGTDPRIGFTVVKYLDLPAESYKSGHYVYLTLNGSVLQTEADDEFKPGTQVKHFGYDLSNYSSPVGPNSVYGLLNSVLFDPILPIWLDNQVHGYRRVIKGSRNALNGAIDEGDESSRGPDIVHSMKMFYVNLGDWGRIGIEYWVLKKPEKGNQNPIKSFVNPQKPIILTLNGQSHAEFSKILISKSAELPYLTQRFIGHIDCNSLTPIGKRALFVSNREDAIRGELSELIQREFIKAIISDDALHFLNTEAHSENIHEKNETEVQQMRKEVAAILRVPSGELTIAKGGSNIGGVLRTERPVSRPSHKRTIKPIELREPPTYIKILWDSDKEIPFYPGQRRYIRVETDANSNYHDPNDSGKSKINIIQVPGIIASCGSTPLQTGRMRIIYESPTNVSIGSVGKIRVELYRQGLPLLSDERSIIIVEEPPASDPSKQLTLPPFEIVPIDPDNDLWETLDWPLETNDVASGTIKNGGILIIYYSTVYPKYAEKLKAYERRDSVMAASFTKKYEVWLAAHSLLLEHDKNEKHTRIESDDSVQYEQFERNERCRLATISAIFAEREVTNQSIKPSEE